MKKANEILELHKNLNNVRYWINFLKNWNKENNKNYTIFTNKQTNNNGCMDLFWLIGEEVRLEKEILAKNKKFKNYYKNNFKPNTNKIFK